MIPKQILNQSLANCTNLLLCMGDFYPTPPFVGSLMRLDFFLNQTFYAKLQSISSLPSLMRFPAFSALSIFSRSFLSFLILNFYPTFVWTVNISTITLAADNKVPSTTWATELDSKLVHEKSRLNQPHSNAVFYINVILEYVELNTHTVW